MRLVAAALISIFLLAGTYFYTQFADSVRRAPAEINVELDDASWRVEIQRTFKCLPDPDYETLALVVQLKGQEVFRREDEIAADETIAFDLPGDVERGRNEIFIEANLATLDDFDFASQDNRHAMRVVVRRGYQVVADKSFWLGEGETTFRESVSFESPAAAADPDEHDDHDDHSP